MIFNLTRNKKVNSDKEPKTLTIGQFGCAHSDRDFTGGGRFPIERAISASLTAGHELDVVHLNGDVTGLQSVTVPEIATAVSRIQADLNNAKATHEAGSSKPFDVKSITGNHSALEGNNSLYQQAMQDWLDANIDSSNEVYDPNADYTFESYHYTKGNCLFFFMGDRNDIEAPFGKNNSPDSGGHPSGAIKFTTLQRFIDVAIRHLDYNIFTQSHQALPDTVVGSSVANGYFGHNELPLAVADYKGTIAGLYDNVKFSGTNDVDENPNIWAKIFGDFDFLTILHASCHSHAPINYKDAGGSHFGKIGKSFCINVGALTQWHGDELGNGSGVNINNFQTPSGTIQKFIEGVDTVYLQRVITEDRNAFGTGEAISHGQIFTSYNRSIPLKKAYRPSYGGISISAPAAVTSLLYSGGVLSWTGGADGFMVVSSSSAPSYVFVDGIAAHVPGYEVAAGEMLESITNKNALSVSSSTSFMVVPFNAGGGDINYGTPTTINP